MGTPKTRVLEDNEGRRATFEDIQVGQSLGEMEWQITDELIDLQCQLDQDFDPMYFPQAEGAKRVAPPSITYRPPRWLFSRAYNVRGLFVGWENEMLRAIEPNMTIKVTGSRSALTFWISLSARPPAREPASIPASNLRRFRRGSRVSHYCGCRERLQTPHGLQEISARRL
jgi:hypothetical protein